MEDNKKENKKNSNEIKESSERLNDKDKTIEMTSDWKELKKNRNLKSPKKGKKILVFLIIVLVVLCGAAFAYFKFFRLESKDIYSLILKEYKTGVHEIMDDTIKKTNTPYIQDGQINLNSNMNDYKIFDKISLDYSLGLNLKDELMSLNFDYKEKDQNILKGDVYLKNDKIYLKSNQIYDKLLYLSEAKDAFDFKDAMSKENLENIQYLVEKSNEYLEKALEKAEYKTENAKITIKGKKTRIQKNIMIINRENINSIKNAFLSSVTNDNKFISALASLEETDQNEITKDLNSAIDEDISKDFKEMNIEIDTKLLFNTPVGIKINYDQKPVVEAVIKSNGKYNVKIYENNTTLLEGTLTVKSKNEIAFESTIENYTYNISLVTGEDMESTNFNCKITDKAGKYFDISAKSNMKFNQKISDISANKAIDISTLSSSEAETIQANLTKIFENSQLFNSLMNSELDS